MNITKRAWELIDQKCQERGLFRSQAKYVYWQDCMRIAYKEGQEEIREKPVTLIKSYRKCLDAVTEKFKQKQLFPVCDTEPFYSERPNDDDDDDWDEDDEEEEWEDEEDDEELIERDEDEEDDDWEFDEEGGFNNWIDERRKEVESDLNIIEEQDELTFNECERLDALFNELG